MKKNIILLILSISIIGFCSCHNTSLIQKEQHSSKYVSRYGSYLAGRVAHTRKDFNAAADYYSKAASVDKNNTTLLSQLYVIYASLGDLSNASEYAKQLQENGDNNDFLDTIIAVDEIKKEDYQQAIDILQKSQNPIYKDFINPLITTWAYVGQKDMKNALNTLKIFKDDKNLQTLYNFQMAMVYDYFNQDKEALIYFNEMSLKQKEQLSFRALQIITNFYLRNNQKQNAINLVKSYKDEAFAPMLKSLLENIKKTNKTPKPIINNPSIGLAESLFSIAATLRLEGQNIDLAHIFVSMAIYSNPKYDLAKLLLADILEDREMFEEANKIYQTIEKTSDAYNISLTKKADNYTKLKEYKKAEKILKKTIKEKDVNSRIYLSLGDSLRLQQKFSKAIKYYNKGIKNTAKDSNDLWVFYYSLGVAYDKLDDYKMAEKMFLKSLELSNNHYLVQNYLGYMWLENTKNTDNALALIIDAYRQAPNDGNIVDSLGYAFYKLGFYNKAIMYLEEATLLEPNNPIISEHLADAYYLNGRKKEAGFLWGQSLLLDAKDSPEYNKESIKDKIKNGLKNQPIAIIDNEFVTEKIKELEGM